MNALKSKLFEYGWFGRALWLIILINVISFIVGIIYNILAWVWLMVKGFFGRKNQKREYDWEVVDE